MMAVKTKKQGSKQGQDEVPERYQLRCDVVGGGPKFELLNPLFKTLESDWRRHGEEGISERSIHSSYLRSCLQDSYRPDAPQSWALHGKAVRY